MEPLSWFEVVAAGRMQCGLLRSECPPAQPARVGEPLRRALTDIEKSNRACRWKCHHDGYPERSTVSEPEARVSATT